MLSRRNFLVLLGSSAVVAAAPARAWASVARPVSLAALVGGSRRIAVVTALEAHSSWESVGGAKRIVTYTRARVDQLLRGPQSDPELIVRTLGGRVGKVGQIVYGEAELLRGRQQLVFLAPGPAGAERVVAMAQGHYPLRLRSGAQVLEPSPRLPEMIGNHPSAVKALVGRSLAEATKLVEEAR